LVEYQQVFSQSVQWSKRTFVKKVENIDTKQSFLNRLIDLL